MLARGMRELIRVHSCVASCQLEQQTKLLIMGGCSLSEFTIKVGIFIGWSYNSLKKPDVTSELHNAG